MLPHLTSFLLPYVFYLHSGSLAGDLIGNRVVSKLKLEHHFVTNKSRKVCSGLDSKCYDISNTLALYEL